MNKLLLAIVMIILHIGCNADKYTVKGTYSDGEVLYLAEYQDEKTVFVDSSFVENGKFSFEGTVDKPKYCGVFLKTGKGNQPLVDFYLENTSFLIDLKTRKVTTDGFCEKLGNKFNAIDSKIVTLSEPLVEKFEVLVSNRDNITKLEYKKSIKEISKEFDFLKGKLMKEKIALMQANPSSIVSAQRLKKSYKKMNIKDAKEVAYSFVGDALNSEVIKNLKDKIAIDEKTAIGVMAPDFTLNNTEGKSVSVSSFKGKMLVIDFWASWCRPCRKETKNLVKLYNKYHNQGLEILSVSLDSSKDSWIKAIKNDGMIWNNVLLDSKKEELQKIYGFNTIPCIFLLDRNGNVIAKNLMGAELDEKIFESLQK